MKQSLSTMYSRQNCASSALLFPETIKKVHLLYFFIPSLLLIPALYYSMTTPFALVDDFGMCYYVEYLDNLNRFLHWGKQQFLQSGHGRYRPFFDLYNMVTWKIFGPTPWLHHLARWALHCAALFSFSAAFMTCTASGSQENITERAEKQPVLFFLLPLAYLVYVWMFFPNSPVSRLGPQELNTVFFLGLCNWMMARMIVQDYSTGQSSSQWLCVTFFYIGYLGLSLSKEINIAVMLWILVFYYLYVRLISGKKRQKIYQGLPLAAIFFYTLFKVYAAARGSHYGVAPVTVDLVLKNSMWILRELFQFDTSAVITTGFGILLFFLLLSSGAKIYHRRITGEIIYVIFVLGQFASMYLVLCTSWAPVLRYWYVLVPVFATLLAFSVRYLSAISTDRSSLAGHGITLLLLGFLVFFIGSNYYNFLMQTVVQHSLRQAESQVISELSELQDKNEYIQIPTIKGDPDAELVYHLRDYFRRFSPRFFGKKYTVHTAPPGIPHQGYYMVTMYSRAGEVEEYKTIRNTKDYSILSWAEKIAALLQNKPEPYVSRDAGAHPLNWHYQWIIYKMKT